MLEFDVKSVDGGGVADAGEHGELVHGGRGWALLFAAVPADTEPVTEFPGKAV